MGCGASSEAGAAAPHEAPAPIKKIEVSPQELAKSSGIDRELDRARQQEELKVKLLLLGAGESGKSTIFKQMRILHGSPRTDDDQKMYGVIVRSNIITAMRKLCAHLRTLGLEDQLAQEAKAGGAEMSPKEAFDLLVSHLVDNTGDSSTLPKPPADDWVGESARAGLSANNDAKLFLALWKTIKILWEVSPMKRITTAALKMWGLNILMTIFTVENYEGSMVQTISRQRDRRSQGLLE